MGTRRTALVIWWVFLTSALGLTALAVTVGPGTWPRVGGRGNAVAWVVFAAAPACLLASWVVPMRIGAGATGESLAVARSVLATSLIGSAAFLAPLGWMVSGRPIALAALTISLVGLLLVAPSRRRWQKLSRGTLDAPSAPGPAAPAAGSKALPRWLVRLVALTFLTALAAGLAGLVALGVLIWDELLGRPGNPFLEALLSLFLALGMAGLGTYRLLLASASRHPRWRRAGGIALVVLAAFCFVRFVQML